MVKNSIVFLFCFWASTVVYAQQRTRVDYLPSFDKRKLHYGFYLGVNQNDFKISLKESTIENANIESVPTPGFNVGLIADFRLHKNLNLRFEPGLASNTKNIYFRHLNNARDSVREVGSTYLHIPLLLKFSTDRLDNVRPFLLAGISYNYNLSSNEANQDDNASGEFRMKTHNFMYEVGIGIDFYLYFFKFSPSIRGVFAINNEIKYDNNANSPWTAPVNYFGTRGLFLTLAFE